MASHSSMLGSNLPSRRTSAPTGSGRASASTRLMLAIATEGRSYSEGLAPLLDHLGDALEDLLDARPNGLELLGGFHAGRGRNFGPDRLAEMVDPDLRRIDAHQIFHVQPGRVRMSGSLHDARGCHDEHGAVGRVAHR